jgi:hypothetical protein
MQGERRGWRGDGEAFEGRALKVITMSVACSFPIFKRVFENHPWSRRPAMGPPRCGFTPVKPGGRSVVDFDGSGIPQPHGPVLATADNLAAIRTEGH